MNTLFKTKKIFITILALIIVVASMYTLIGKKANPESSGNAKISTEKNAETNKKEFKIIAFGDSLTAGLGVDLKDSYPAILENILNTDEKYRNYNLTFRVINMGVSGETTSGGLDRIDFVLEQKPDLVLFGLGANDMLRSTNTTLVADNINSMVNKITYNKVPLVLLGMQSATSNGRDYKKDFDSIYPLVAKKYNIPLVKFFLEGVALVPRLNTPDGIHPNRLGYEEIVGKNILPVLKPTLKSLLGQ